MFMFASMSYNISNMLEIPMLNSEQNNLKKMRNKCFQGRSSMFESLKECIG